MAGKDKWGELIQEGPQDAKRILLPDSVIAELIADGAVGTDAVDDDLETWIQAGWGTWRTLKDFGVNHLLLDAGTAEWVMGQYASQLTTAALSNYNTPVKQCYIDSADFPTVTGKTLKLRVRGWANVNGTDAGGDVAFKMKPITYTGAADTLTHTLGAQVGNTATITNANLTTNETEKADSTSFSLPANGVYTVTVTPSANPMANNAVLQVAAEIQYRWE